jgi:hypothetical protein
MPPSPHDFKHLNLSLKIRDRARLLGGGRPDPRTAENKENRVSHGGNLQTSGRNLSNQWKTNFQNRQRQNLPEVPPGIPFLLKIDPTELDLDFLYTMFNLEVVSEQEDGYVLVASGDFELEKFFDSLEKFVGNVSGGGGASKIYALHEDTDSRLQRILSEQLYQNWPNINDNNVYIVEIGIECLGTNRLTDPPEKKDSETEDSYQQKLSRWKSKADNVYQQLDQLRIERESSLQRFVEGYDGKFLTSFIDGETSQISNLPDSFTTKISISGKGLKDLVQNYAFVFEVTEPDDISDHYLLGQFDQLQEINAELIQPDVDAPKVCVIDSGIQEGHRYLAPAIDSENSFNYVSEQLTDVADGVQPGGHGTRVAGAILYPRSIPRDGLYNLPCWIQNARVLNNNNELPPEIFPPAILNKIVERYHCHLGTKIFNHSISSTFPCRKKHMSAWGAEIDRLSHDYDVLFIQAAGNIFTDSDNPFRLGILQHIQNGRNYPAYLLEDSCRVANPAQSFNALTVGSVSEAVFSDGIRTSLGGVDFPSAFSATGPGIWDVIKPDIVEYGGTYAVDNGNPPRLTSPEQLCPELLRANNGPAYSRDAVGTSFAAPKVTHIAAELQKVLPDEPPLLWRALIAQSARWPEWAINSDPQTYGDILRLIGFGLPSLERATSNNNYRMTFITSGTQFISARDIHIFEIVIPESLRNIGEEYDLLIEVTLSYAASPRRTRLNKRGYLSTWLEWRSSYLGESPEHFGERNIHGRNSRNSSHDGVLPWVIREQNDWGDVQGLNRTSGTLQKDWALLKSHQLREGFCIGVVAHEGWDKNPDSKAKYTLAVSFEAINKDIEIYNDLRVANEIEQEIEQEQEVEIEI